MEEKGFDLSLMDRDVRPQDDFYNFVNGNWMKTAKIPADKATWGSFNKLAEDTDNQALKILNELLEKQFPEGSEGRKIQSLYATYMDREARDKAGLEPLQPVLDQIEMISDLKGLQEYLTQADREGNNPLYGWGVDADMMNSKMNAVYLGNPSLGLGRDYYQKEDDKNKETLQKYTEYIAAVFNLLGMQDSAQRATAVVAWEKEIAKTYLTNEQIRDARLFYNPREVPKLKELVHHVDLEDFLQKTGVQTDVVILGELHFFEQFDQIITEENLSTIRDYLRFHLVNGSAGFLNQKTDELKFEFYGRYLTGQQEQRALNKRAYQLINGTLGEAFGKLYVARYFPQEAKAQMLEMIAYLKNSLHRRIQNLRWMSEETKEKALEKLDKFSVKVAFPDKWEDYSQLEIVPKQKGGTLYSNLLNITKWHYDKELKKVGKPVDKSKWEMTPQTVNAYYNPVNNEIVFPAAILQPPFFNPAADPAVNFGGIGAVIGHEMTHGFDDSGAQFDGEGNLKDWWTPEDKENFEKVTKRLAEQFGKYETVPGAFVNGTFTNGENIADLGGVNISFEALQQYLKDKGNTGEISGFSQEQRFFISWATIWRTLASDEYKANQVKVDPHSPGYFRSFGPLVNTDAFYRAFDVKPGDQLFKKPEDRIEIW